MLEKRAELIFPHPCPKKPADRPLWKDVPGALVAKIEGVLGGKIASAAGVLGGYGPSACFSVMLENHARFFLKGTHPGQEAHGKKALEQEIQAYERLADFSLFMPRYIGQVGQGDDDDWHLGIFSYIDKAQSPLPWTEKKIVSVFLLLGKIHGKTGSSLPHITDCNFIAGFLSPEECGWIRLAREEAVRQRFLSIFSNVDPAKTWLDRALPLFLNCSKELSDLLKSHPGIFHGDLRSDNILLDENGKFFLVDWTNACEGPVILDLVFFICGLSAETGYSGKDLLSLYTRVTGISFSRSDVQKALVSASGYYALQAGKPVPKRLPQLRWVQKQHLWGALHWLADVFDIPPPPYFSA